jgi:5-methyltetrahydropteroyltriglutamate--homocysteine methyltransferase
MYALADALMREYTAIVDAGFVLQVDCPMGVASRCFPGADSIRSAKKVLEAQIEVLNYALADIPAEQSPIHMCWGSDEGPHHLDIELKDIIDLLLTVTAAGMTIVGANGGHEHEWRRWKHVKVPDGKVIIPGVIDSTTNIIEHPEVVAERIVRFANVLGGENIIAGVDCGFSTVAGTENFRVDPKIAWAKLRALADGAELATRQLWGD